VRTALAVLSHALFYTAPANRMNTPISSLSDTSIGSLIADSAISKRESEMIVGAVLGCSRASVMAHPERVPDALQHRQIAAMMARRSGGEPMAYILGVREFYGREFIVTPAVLIPRPETEVLVEQALARLSSHRPSQFRAASANVLDLGTGSGAIAVSVAAEHPQASVVATDISGGALAIAKQNALRHGAHIRFVESDWFTELAGEKFDLILSNPPYVAHGDSHLATGDLRFEPLQALTDQAVGQHGLACIRHIIGAAPRHLHQDGWLLFEHGYNQAEACRELLTAGGFVDLVAIADLAGITRVSGGRLC